MAVSHKYGMIHPGASDTATVRALFVIDPQGILRYQGALNDITFRRKTPTRHYLKDAVNALLRGESPEPAETSPYGCTIVYYAQEN